MTPSDPKPNMPERPATDDIAAGALESVRRAMASGRYCIVAYSVVGQQVLMDANWRDFPHSDMPEAVRMLRDRFSEHLRTTGVAVQAEPVRTS